MLIFNLDADAPLAGAIAADLDATVAPHEHRVFEDGECKLRPLVDPRGADAYVIHSLHGDARRSPHDKLFELLSLVATLRDHAAARVSAVVPYLAYARKDRRTQPWDPLGQRLVAQLIEAAGAQQVFVLEPHDTAACQNAFRIPLVAVPAHPAFDAVVDELGAGALVVASPDPGGVKRALLWRAALQERRGAAVGFAMLDKRRSGGVVRSDDLVCGPVDGATVLLLDDLVATGGTLARAARALREAGARRVIAFAAHGLFVEPAATTLLEPALEAIVVTESVPASRIGAGDALRRKLRIVTAGPLLAGVLRDSHAAWPE